MTSERQPSAYQRITGADWHHIFVVGDIHGCYRQLMTALDHVGFDTGCDLLVSVGDLIDRGPQNLACLDLLQQRWFRAVRGNHEQMALDALNDSARIPLWRANGGDWFFQLDDKRQALARRLLALTAQLPYVIEIDTAGRRTVVAHADYPADCYQFDQPLPWTQVLWNRQRVSQAMAGVGGPIAGADRFLFGHTPLRQALTCWNLQYIDTGAVFGGELTLPCIQGGGSE
ncbi:Serine/threonine protein phosphatase 1 [Dickeya dadantii 3937]|uniref:Serine/threonine protein phosphatase 1 n=1 Tax=Dickeya dadantii (strain 3937) TaxID=198628 RepID=E0SF51_DICD3|nr:metallophosphoesterase [Dickeya dadantii]ADM98793.1 Serine/threonine protein phosphatase 1 [Dickeya dadantii 3937]